MSWVYTDKFALICNDAWKGNATKSRIEEAKRVLSPLQGRGLGGALTYRTAPLNNNRYVIFSL